MNVKKVDGTVEAFEVIASFELADFSKTYVTYTAGDVDVNNNIITYTNTIVDGNLMPVETDQEWAKIKEVLLKMTKGATDEIGKMVRPVVIDLVETATTKSDARFALSISKEFKNAIQAQYDALMPKNEAPAEPTEAPGGDIAVPSFNVDGVAPAAPEVPVEASIPPVPVPEVEEPVVPAEPVAPVEVPVTPMPAPEMPVEVPVEEPVVPVVEEPQVDVKAELDKIVAMIEELKAKL